MERARQIFSGGVLRAATKEKKWQGKLRVPSSVAVKSKRTLPIYTIRKESGENATRSNFSRRAILTYIGFFFQLRFYMLCDIAVIRKFSAPPDIAWQFSSNCSTICIRFNRMQPPVVICSPLYTSRAVSLMGTGNR